MILGLEVQNYTVSRFNCNRAQEDVIFMAASDRIVVSYVYVYLSQEDVIEEEFSLGLFLGDVGVGVHAKDLRVSDDWKVLGVL